MATDTDSRRNSGALVALTRFGLGARPGDMRRIASDPRGAVRAELAMRDAALLPDPYLVSAADSSRHYQERKALRQLLTGRKVREKRNVVIETMVADGRLPKELVQKAALLVQEKSAKKPSGEAMADPDMGGSMAGPEMAGNDMSGDMDGRAPAKAGKKGKPGRVGLDDSDAPAIPTQPMDDEAAARFVRVRNAEIGFVERLVSFWGDHLTVSTKGGGYIRWVAGAYDREAIRPHVLGRFEDMLLASARHSAMTHYLDNQASIGPNSEAARRNGKGLNENYARELLELHTVGAGAGYTQADVIELAKALTGWRVEKGYRADNLEQFDFAPRAHEPGERTVVGKRYAEGGAEQGEAILRDLARHPATAARLARKLAVAFVADEPPPALVDRLERTFRDTGGDLKEVAGALVSSDEAWDAPRAKMRSPQEFVFASIRLVGRQPKAERLIEALNALGQPMWGASQPKGYSIVGRDWIAPDAQTNRLDFAADLARDHADAIDPNALAEDILGETMSDETRTAVKRAGSREQAFALLVMSPEMQRR